ncbi:MAG TPA: isoprenyl transferase [Capsulimonadaceae bacterium]|jgi:undecaprenyl diphosphate synthase
MPAVAPTADIATLKSRLDPARMPEHVAIIMDGNGRWAKRRGLPRIVGHGEGYKTVRQIVHDAGELGIKVLTVYAFSVENWKRPQAEIDGLMRLIEQAIKNEIKDLQANNVRFRVLGRRSGLPDSLVAQIDRATSQTAANTGLTLNLALNYGGRAEIADAVREIARKAVAGEINPDDITEQTIAAHVYAPELPDPDLLIRTAGEMRFSNFLLWGSAYAEFWVTSTLWPDFNSELLTEAIVDFQGRVRKFGQAVDQ